MTQEAIDFTAGLLQQKKPALSKAQCSLLAEVCVHSSNALILVALRNPDQTHRQQLVQQIEDLLVSYLEPYVGDDQSDNVMKVMICPHCQSEQLTKNGYRRGKQCYRCKDCGKQFVENSHRLLATSYVKAISSGSKMSKSDRLGSKPRRSDGA